VTQAALLADPQGVSNDPTFTWRNGEAGMLRRRTYFGQRYGTRPYLGKLGMLTTIVASCERHDQGLASSSSSARRIERRASGVAIDSC
jgi:hypothetical protein